MKTSIKIIISIVILSSLAFSVLSFKKEKNALKEVTIKNSISIVNDSLFKAYWYAGSAEIKTYNLTQARYGELHEGITTVIFVTEPFLKEKGVKPNNRNKNQVPVLKMNMLKKFGTGIYPYSMMLSTFTPLKESAGLVKATASWTNIFANEPKKKYL